MTTLLVIVWVIAAVFLIIILAMRPERTRHSLSELRRRDNQPLIRREKLLGDVLAVRRIVTGLLLVVLVLVGLAAWQSVGVIATILLWLIAGAVSRLKFIHTSSMKLYGRMEPSLLSAVERVSLIGWLFKTEKYAAHDQKLESPEHLLHLVGSSGSVLSDAQRMIITRGLTWHTTPVSSVMIKAKNIVSIKHSELLGPLVLDDLHRSGHTRFPVVRGTIDNVVGMLDISQLLDVTVGKRSETAEKTMLPQVLHIESDEPLPVALELLQKSHQHMLIVVDDEGKTTGLVTLSDITGSLLGKNRGGVV